MWNYSKILQEREVKVDNPRNTINIALSLHSTDLEQSFQRLSGANQKH